MPSPLKPHPPIPIGRVTRPFATVRTTGALILREMTTRFGKTPGGYIWAIVEPFGAILLMALAFSLLVQSPSLGTSFFLFYATGYLIFNLYQTVSMFVSRAITFSKPLLFYPSVTWVDAIMARFFLNTVSGIIVICFILSGAVFFGDAHVIVTIGHCINAIILAAILGLGIGTLTCFLIGVFPLWNIIWGIVTRPLFLASGVMFTYEDLPTGVQNILWYNPVLHITGIMRMGFYPMYNPTYISYPYIILIALITLTLGLLLLRRNYRKILNF